MVERRYVELADVGIEVVLHDPAAHRTADWFFGPSIGPAAAAAADLVIELGREVERPTDRPPDGHDGPVQSWWSADRLDAAHESGAAATADGQRIVIGRSDETTRWRSDRQLLFTALSWWFERREAIVLHAAALVIDGTALVVAGPTGAGKSTCVAAAIEHGWEVLSDDLVVIRVTDRVRAFGVPKRVALDAQQLANIDRASTPLDDDERMRRTLPVTFARRWVDVAGLVAVGHHGGAGASEPLPHVEALATVMASWPEAVRADARSRGLPHIAALAGLPAFSLLHSNDATDRTRAAADRLRAIAERATATTT
jgi:hypothetical protein